MGEKSKCDIVSHLLHLGSVFLILLFQQEFANLFLAEVAAPENLI